MMKKKVAAIYVRVSTQEQSNPGYVMTTQVEVLRQYCQKMNIAIHKIYQDLAVTGNRPGLVQLMNDAQAHYFNTVVIWRISLLSSSLQELTAMVERFTSQGIALISYTEKFDTSTATGMMTLHILGNVLDSQRDIINENVKQGLRKAAKQGKRTGGALLGYESRAGKLQIIEEEAKVVQLIFDLYLNHKMSMGKIAQHLNTRKYRTKRGKAFGKDAIGRILSNPAYIGFNRVKSATNGQYVQIPGAHQPIIAKETWEKVQERRQQKASHHALRHEASQFLLSGVIKCPYCGSALISAYSVSTKCLKNGQKKKYRYRYYKCSGFERQLTGCEGKYLSADRLEQAFFDYINRLVAKPEIIAQKLDKVVTALSLEITPLITERQDLYTRIDGIKSVRERYYLLFETGKLNDVDGLIERLNELEKKLSMLETRCKQITKEIETKDIVPITAEQVRAKLNYLLVMSERGDLTACKKIVQNTIKEVFLTKEKPITIAGIEFNLSQKPQVKGLVI